MKKADKIRENYERVSKFLTHDIWVLDFTEISRVKARFMRYLQVSILTIKGISTDKIGLQATSLSFFAALSVVPLVALLFAVTGGFGLHKWMENLMLAAFDENGEVVEWILTFAKNIINTSRNGLYGFISLCVFLWTIIWLMLSIERYFNEIWKVENQRKFVKRIAYYAGILLLSPFVIIVFLWTSLLFTDTLDAIDTGIDLTSIKTFILWLIAYGVISCIFTLLYKYVPHTKVNFTAAFNAAIVTAAVFTATQYIYFETQLFVSRLNSIYGAFAAIPLFLIWINTSWWIILLGAELSHAFQNVDSYQPNNMTRIEKL